ncbi:TolC family protein [Dyadobacter tibetensis]|uniref:TolC family protein n=1 Tax=Dyadobacter tibetensis TaxID=1211851 RepID=UPI000471D948|nr:TolC family protein [Dyadobacter tibetensis]
MKMIILLLFVTLCSSELIAQPKRINLNWCYEQSEANYPMVKQRNLIASTAAYTLENARKGLLPQVNIYGQATYQSAVTGLPLKLPGNEMEPISKDQYKLYGEITQTVYDGGAVAGQRRLTEARMKKEHAEIRSELYQLRKSVNQIYFSILLVDNRLEVIDLRRRDLQTALELSEGAVMNGTALPSHTDQIRVELLVLDQSALEQKILKDSYLSMLTQYTGQAITPADTLEIPSEARFIPEEITRLELDVIDAQRNVIGLQSSLLLVKSRPKFNLFIQGGYGRPALNFLSNNFELYGIGGLRMIWPLSARYTLKGEKSIYENNLSSLEVQRELFLFHTKMGLIKERAEIEKWHQLLTSDVRIIELRNRIKTVAAQQLKEGTILPADFIREVNAEALARENLSFHKIQYLLYGYNLKASLGQ